MTGAPMARMSPVSDAVTLTARMNDVRAIGDS